mmetsp:Transcript_46769/g.134721  ORF Transcript_46769/g.134721 Transcript_46769/m.134721 type:complete len:82 (+) Transcript_46769:345-590(+)
MQGFHGIQSNVQTLKIGLTGLDLAFMFIVQLLKRCLPAYDALLHFPKKPRTKGFHLRGHNSSNLFVQIVFGSCNVFHRIIL